MLTLFELIITSKLVDLSSAGYTAYVDLVFYIWIGQCHEANCSIKLCNWF